MSKLIELMEKKLARLEAQFDELYETAPWVWSGGTPFVENAKGARYKSSCDKHSERMSALRKEIEDQKEKIEKTRDRIALRSIPTKKSEMIILEQGESIALKTLADEGVLTQWKKNPHLFFVNGVGKTALIWANNRVGVSARYPFPPEEEARKVNAILEVINTRFGCDVLMLKIRSDKEKKDGIDLSGQGLEH